MIQAAALLYKLTGERRYLEEAQAVAAACHDYFFRSYTDAAGHTRKLLKNGDIWFTAVMLRGFVELYHADRDGMYLQSFRSSLDYAWEHAREQNVLFNTDFTGDTRQERKWLLTQAAFVEMYARLAK